MKLPPLGAFRVFDMAAQTQSFVKAAELLHVTHGAVSRQIRLLEDALGVALFERRNRAVFLTPAGHTLHGTTLSIFEQIENTVYRLKQQARESVVVLSCEPTIAMKWLIPRLPAFQAAHPEIHLHLSAAGGPIDFAKAGIDLALRRDDFHWDKALHVTPICDEWIGTVWCANQGRPSTGLAGLTQLHTKSRPQAWKTWLRQSGISAKETGRMDYEHFYLCIQAAIAGLGVAISSFFMVQDDLQSGQLLAPYGFVKDGSSYCLLSARPISEAWASQQFVRWVTVEMQGCVEQIT